MVYARIMSVLGFSLYAATVVAEPAAAGKQTPIEIMPITAANVRGHQSLYREGWFLVTSTEQALTYAKQHSLTASGAALAQVRAEIARRSAEYGGDMSEVGTRGVQTGATVFQKGTDITRKELAGTAQLATAEIDYGSRTMQRAWQKFIKGNLTLAERTEDDRKALVALPGKAFSNIRADFSNLHELSTRAHQTLSSNVEANWGDAFAEAREDFDRAYARSGTRGNSLSGLGDVMAGYARAIYSGLFKPTARASVQGAEASVKLAADVIFLPVAGLFIVTEQGVVSTGLSLYYTTAMGVKLVSPTVEGGLLAALSLASYSTVPVTYTVGGAAGAINQVAVVVAAPVAGAGHAAASAVGDTAVYAAQVSYDLLAGTTKVAFNQAQSGVVLGYNALTALPTQTILGLANGVVFLAWDGPRLVVATARGRVHWSDENGVSGTVPVESVPVGTVIDLRSLVSEPDVETQIISDDPAVIEKVLEQLPQDLRVGGKP